MMVSGQSCPDFLDYSKGYHPPFSAGRYNLSYQRPSGACRTFSSQAVEDTITRISSTIADPDLFRLFQNSYPNTLDTAIKWKGYAAGTDEELTFVITGDMYSTQDRLPAIRVTNALQQQRHVATRLGESDAVISLSPAGVNGQQLDRILISRRDQSAVTVPPHITLLQFLPAPCRIRHRSSRELRRTQRQGRARIQQSVRFRVQIRARLSGRLPRSLHKLLRRHAGCRLLWQIPMGRRHQSGDECRRSHDDSNVRPER